MTRTAIGQRPSWRLKITLALEIVGILAYTCSPSLAQITPDATLGAEGSVVTPNVNIRGFPADFIQGGATRGANLFHSFEQFNVGIGQRVYFANPAGIETILTRVTGNNLSNILGTLGVTGRADLFLLNPNGIIFGPNARLDVGGSFVATTANSFVFGDGLEFSATNPATPPLLTISVPLGLQYGPQPGAITSQGILVVNEGQSLILAGGEITLDDSYLAVNFFEGGRVELAAVAGEGIVGLNADGNLLSLSFPDGLERADVSFTNGAGVDVRLNNGGDIAITARNIDISGESSLLAGIYSGLGSTDSQAGDITLDATDTIRIDQSNIRNIVFRGSTGNAGDIRINTGSLSITNGAQLNASTFGQGNGGDVIIDARDQVFLGKDVRILNGVQQGGIGNGGNIRINTGMLSLTDEASMNTFTFGQGNAGDVIIEARDRVSLDNDASIFSFTDSGIGGNIRITTGLLSIDNSAQLQALTYGQGRAGNVIINARDQISLNNRGRISSQAAQDSTGNGGDVRLTTGSLLLSDRAQLGTVTYGQGNAGDVIINARDQVSLNNSAGILSNIEGTGNVEGGDIRITTGSLIVTNLASLQTATIAQGNAGNIIINARDRVLFEGGIVDGPRSSARSQVSEGAIGHSGNVEITTGSLEMLNEAGIIVSTFGQGNAGNVIINARDNVSLDRSTIFSVVNKNAVGRGGNINITTGSLSLTNGGQLDASTFGQGNSGNITVTARDTISLDGTHPQFADRSSTLFTEVFKGAQGDGGDIQISTGSLVVTNGGQLDAKTRGRGNAGNIFITARDSVLFDGNATDGRPSRALSSVDEGAVGIGGNIEITAEQVKVSNGAVLTAETRWQGRAGNITLNTNTLSLSDRAQIASSSQGTGNAGGVTITANEAITLTNSDITTSAPQAAGGVINITTDFLTLNRGRITAATGTSGAQGAANITLQDLDLLLMGNESLISANALNQANGGNVAIDSTFIVATPPQGPKGSNITANAFQGNGGKVSITTQGLFGIEFRPQLTPDNDITVSSEFGLDGVYEQSTPGVDPSRGLAELPTNVVDASEQIDRRCTPRGANQGSSFIITGRGGLPPSPNDPLQGESVITNWVNVDSQMENNTPPAATTPSSSAPRQLVEAQGWVINEKGQVVLTEQAPSVTPTESGFLKLKCNVSNQL